MPLTNTICSRGMPICGSTFFITCKNGIVAAAGAPADVLVAGEIVGGQGGGKWGFRWTWRYVFELGDFRFGIADFGI